MADHIQTVTNDPGHILCTLQGVNVTQYFDGRIEFTADADIDADGSPHAYHPDSRRGLDDLANAGHPGNWWGIAVNGFGHPIIQTARDPAPGYFVSTTAYEWTAYDKSDPRRYVDSEEVPFIVVENFIRRRAKGIVLGCRCRVTNELNGKNVEGVVADIGPLNKIGELSIAAAEAIGIPSSPRTGGEPKHVITYELFPGEPAVIGGKTYNLIRV
jgi:hypothetical protein